jgi:putative MATE family efflux protein
MQKNFSLVGKNIHRIIFQLSIPGMVSSVLQTLYQLIDAYWVGKLGAEALAAIGGSAFILWAVFSLSALSVNGIMTLVSQNIGAGNTEAGRLSAGQGMIINSISAIIFAVSVYFTQDILYNVMGFSEQVRAEATSYMNIILSGLLFSFWFVGLEGVFRGLGDTRTPMYVLGLALAMNAILDPILIFGWLNVPAMGIAGAGLATIIAHSFAALLASIILYRKDYIPTIFHNGKIRIQYSVIFTILQIGSPIAFGGFFFSVIYVFLTNIISHFGTEAIAAIGVCHRIEGIAWFACVGYSIAASTLVGQYIGAKKVSDAKKAAWWVNVYGVISLLIVSIVFYFWPDVLMKIFTSNVTVQKIGMEYLKIIAIIEVFLAFEVIIEGIFSGAGYTFPVMFPSVIITAARIPIAWYLAFSYGMGYRGIWVAIAVTTFLKGLINTVLFAMGLWKKKINQIVKHPIPIEA